MTFVYRSRNQSQIFDSTRAGSNDLERTLEKTNSIVTSLPLGQIPRKISPGPGAYDNQKQSTINQIANAVFKNEEERFKDDKSYLIGPGYYEQQTLHKQKQQALSHRPKIIEQLMFAGSYQTANSIPYEKREQINVGPGYYQIQMNKHHSMISDWSRRSTKQEELEPTIGPGHYDVERFYKYRSRKINQTSKLHTSFDPKCYVKKGLDNKIYYSFHKSSTPDSDSSQYEYLDDATPGPGYYQTTQSTTQSSGTKFVSKVPRFALKRLSALGPGYYNPPEVKLNQSIEFQKAERFQQQRQLKSPSPVSYSPKVTMKDQLVQKLLQSPYQEVGSKLPRFPKKRIKPSPGPGYYEIIQKEEQKMESSLSPFKSKVKRTSLEKVDQVIPAPGTYKVSLGSIEDKLQSQIQYLNEQLIDRPPFGCGDSRWKKTIIEESDEERIERSSNYKKPEAKEQPAFGIGQNRFRDKSNDFPDPLSYNINLPWVKRSFNFLNVKK